MLISVDPGCPIRKWLSVPPFERILIFRQKKPGLRIFAWDIECTKVGEMTDHHGKGMDGMMVDHETLTVNLFFFGGGRYGEVILKIC